MPTPSRFASGVETETAFDVLAVAKRLVREGKRVIELEIGDSPFPSSPSAAAAIASAIASGHCRYAPSAGLPEFRQAAAEYLNREYGYEVTAEQIVAGPGAKNFEQLFLEAFVDPDDGVLVFTPHFPTYPPNIARRSARMVTSTLKESMSFRPDLDEVRHFLDSDPSPKAIILNSPHNPTGGVAAEEDLLGIAELIRGRDVAVLSDEPYDAMVWQGKHRSLAAMPGMADQCVAAYSFSKSFSMSGWRLGFAVSSRRNIELLAKLTNTSLSCVPPFTQLAGVEVLRHDRSERDRRMNELRNRIQLLVDALNTIESVRCQMPAGAFYAFANVSAICRQHAMTSHGLAMYLLEGADPDCGVACLGGECFGEAGQGFLRFSVAEPPERLREAVEFIRQAVADRERIAAYLRDHPRYHTGSQASDRVS